MKANWLACVLVLSACATEQKPTSFPVEVTANRLDGPSEVGWNVQLESAHACVGPVRFYPGKVLLAERVKRFLWMPFGGIAQAHPGHYIPGEALGEVLRRNVVDLLAAAPVEIGIADAVTGEYGSLQLTLQPCADADTSNVLSGHSLRLKGIATKDAQNVLFDAYADLSTPIEGIRSEADVTEGARRVTLNIQLARWLSRIDFATATASDPSLPAVFADGSQAQNALIRGASDTSAYVVTWAQSENSHE